MMGIRTLFGLGFLLSPICAARGTGPAVELVLSADPIRAATSGSINFSSQGHVAPGRLHGNRSSLVIKNSSGVVVATATPPYVPENLKKLGGEWSSSGGPRILGELPPGHYTATWTVAGHDSNVVRFAIDPRPPDRLWLEPAECGERRCLALHIFNAGPEAIELVDSISASRLMVDGVVHKSQGIAWIGGSALAPGHAYGWILRPTEQFGTDIDGPHVVSVEFAGRWSNKVQLNRY